MEPKKFYTHAERLITSANPDESDLRSGISRAYYSLFHESTLVLKSKHKEKFAEGILAKLEEWKKCHPEFEYNAERIKSIDETYISANHISTHTHVATTLKSINSKLGRRYNAAKAWRNESDYRLDLPVKKEDTIDRLERIRQLIEDVKNL